MQIDFSGKRVLVTGGTRGIGRGIVEGFLKAGARVALNGSSEETTHKAMAALGSDDRVVAAPGSVETAAGCEKVVSAAVEGLGGLDILINNAGVAAFDATVETTDEELWDRILDINLKGVFFTTKYATPHLRKSRGNIVNITSCAGLIANPGASAYGASKAGIINLTKTHAIEFGDEIRVNAVAPGAIETDMIREIAAQIGEGDVEAGYELIREPVAAQKRVGQVSEVVGPVLFMASDLASFATGSVYVVDGGESAD